MKRYLSRAILAASALLLSQCATLPAVTASRVDFGEAASTLQLVLAGPVGPADASVVLERYAATVSRCPAYTLSVTAIETSSWPAAVKEEAPMVTSRVAGSLFCSARAASVGAN